MSDILLTKNDDDDEIEEPVSPKILTSDVDIVKAKTLKVHDVYIYGPIEQPKAYIELSKNLLKADPEQEYFRFRIASPGGSCHGIIALINAIRQCNTVVEMHVDSPSYSAAATLALAGDALYMHRNTLLMFHNYSGGSYGKGGELKTMIKEEDMWIRKYMRDIHHPFLTADECSGLEKDQDVWIHSSDKDLKKRIDRHFSKPGERK